MTINSVDNNQKKIYGKGMQRENIKDCVTIMEKEGKLPHGERKLARGTLWSIFAKGVYLLSTYLIYLSIGRILGPENFGIFGAVFAILNITFVFFLLGTAPSVSKHIAGDVSIAFSVTRAALKAQLIVGVFLSSLIFFGAEFIALRILKDNSFTFYIRLASLTIIPLALNCVYAGSLLGVRSFTEEAKTLIFKSVVRAVLAIGLVIVGFGISGAIFGYICAAIFGMLYTRSLCKFPKSNTRYETKKIVAFAIPLVVSGGIVSLLLNMDTVLLKRIIGNNDQVGYYVAASTMAQSFHYLALAFSASLLPTIASAYNNKDIELTRKYICQGVRYFILIVVPIVAIVSSNSNAIMSFLYGNNFISAGLPLSILICGLALFSLSAVLSTSIVAIGQPWTSTSFLGVAAFLSLICNLILISKYGMFGAAIATTTACAFSLILTGIYVSRKFKIMLNMFSFLRILLAGAFVYLIAKILPISGIALPFYCILLVFLYVIALFVLREVHHEDYEVVRGILGKNTRSMSMAESK
jgi:stage V sporulation protein B